MLLKDKEDTQDKQTRAKKRPYKQCKTKQDKGTSKKYKMKNRTMI